MPIAPVALIAGVPLLAAGAKYLYENPRRVLQKGIEGLELASGLKLSQIHPYYGASLAAKAASRLLGLQQEYPSNIKYYPRKLETVYARSFKNAQDPSHTSTYATWRRKKIWPKKKIWSKKNWRSPYQAKRTWRTYPKRRKRNGKKNL